MADDRYLWEKICQGDARAFEAFYRETAPHLEAFLQRVVRNPQAAEDLAQEAFMQIWIRPNGFHPDRGSLRGYLYGIGRKRAADWWRKREVGRAREEDDGNCKAERASTINDAFNHLPEEQRTLLWLREVEGQSYVELSEILEIPVGTVRSRLFTAREALREVWQNPRESSKESQ